MYIAIFENVILYAYFYLEVSNVRMWTVLAKSRDTTGFSAGLYFTARVNIMLG